MVKNLIFWTGLGLLIGFGLVWWVQPDAGGAGFLVVVAVIVCNTVGYVFSRLTLIKRGRNV